MTKPNNHLPALTVGELLETRERFALLGSMLGGMIHNLNNPLNAVMGVAQLMELRLPGDKDIPRLLKYVDELAQLLRDMTNKVQFEERLPRIDDLAAWLTREMRFYRFHLGFKHGVEVRMELDANLFPVVDIPPLPMTTFLFRFVDWLGGVVNHHQKAQLSFSSPDPASPRMVLELQLVEPQAATASQLEDVVGLLTAAGISNELRIESDTELSWQMTFSLPEEQPPAAPGN